MAKVNTLRLAAVVAAAIVAALLLVTGNRERASAATTSSALDTWAKVEKITGTVTQRYEFSETDTPRLGGHGFSRGSGSMMLQMSLDRVETHPDYYLFKGSGTASATEQMEEEVRGSDGSARCGQGGGRLLG